MIERRGVNRKKAILWLRISFWIGIVIDCLAALQLFFPSIFAVINRPNSFHPDVAYQYASGTAACLMIGWTFLLFWTQQKPVERRGVLIITIFPVIVGLVVTEICGDLVKFIPLRALVPVWILQGALICLFAFSYLKSRNLRSSNNIP